mgnify:FL=1
MKEQSKTEIKVGITVLIGLIIFLWIFGWAKNLSIRSSENFIKIRFKNVSGLEIGDPVTINGLRKGYVNDIIIKNNDLIVEAAIDNDVKIKEDAKYSIVMLDLMGGKKIDIEPGFSENEIDFNKIQNGVFQSDIPSVMALLGSVQDDLVTVLKDVKAVLSQLNKVLSDDSFVKELRQLVNNINNLSNQMNVVISENRADINKLAKTATELTENTNNLILDNRESVEELINNFNVLSKETKDLLQKINSFTDETNKRENNLGKILYDDELLNNLKSSIKQLEALTKILVEQLNSKGIKVDAYIF